MNYGISRRSVLAVGAGIVGSYGLGAGRASAAEPVTVTLDAGELRGVRSDGVMRFRGIPYADTTAGSNRFKAPQPVRPWTGVRDATRLGPLAPQVKASMGDGKDPIFEWYHQPEPMGEDCLVLNVFTPETSGSRPVLFYIHGGGYINGGGGGTGLDGGPLATFGDVVVVTINHRLNAFGYTAVDDPAFEDAANAGHLDIVAALAWVRDNIARFGGDPRNVTLFGQSGGGSKIMSLIAMPSARGLFHKAISMSGAAGLSLDPKPAMKPYVDAFLKEFGVDDLQAVQGVDFDEVLKARLRAVSASGLEGARPVIDGKHILHQTMSPEGMAVHGGIPLILGHTESEATLFFRDDMRNFSLTEPQMRSRLRTAYAIDDRKVDRIVAAYRAAEPRMTPSQIMIAVASDVQFRLPLTTAARQRTAVAGQAPVWIYDFGWSIPAFGGVLGSPHAVDIPFAFGTMEAAAAMIGSGDSGPETALNMMDAFVSFARTGKPSSPRMPKWAPFSTGSEPTMRIDRRCQVFERWRSDALNEVSDLKIDPFNRASLYRYAE